MKMFKLKEVLEYVEMPNELDQKVHALEEKFDLILDKLKSLEEYTHPPAIDLKEWQDVKDAVKKMKKLRVFKSLGKK